MNCPKCGAENINGSTFCIKCGANLKELQSMVNNIDNAPINEQVAQPIFMESQNQSIQQPIYNQQQVQQPIYNQQPVQQPIYNQQPVQQPVYNQQPVQQSTNVINKVSLNYLMYMIIILLKPIKCFKEEESKLNDSKTSIILALLVSIVMTVVNMIKTIFNTVRVSKFSWTDGYTHSWEWSNLKNIKWLELIGKNFLIYACIILAITLVFYLGSLIVKKQLSFIKSLSIATTSIIPAVIGIMILAPLGGMIWSQLSMIFMAVGAIYTIIILYELMNSELKLEGDAKIYFNLVCFIILAAAGYYLCMKLIMSSVTGGLNNILDMFK